MLRFVPLVAHGPSHMALVGVGIALLFGFSAVGVLRAGTRHLREGAPA